MSNDHRCRHPTFQFAPEPRHVPSLLARIAAWCADHFAFISAAVCVTAFLAGMLTGATW